MKIVIKISEEDYKRGTVMASAIRSGVPLPKSHGRLIDADAYLEEEKPKGIAEETWKESHTYKSIMGAPTIIEAESEEKTE